MPSSGPPDPPLSMADVVSTISDSFVDTGFLVDRGACVVNVVCRPDADSALPAHADATGRPLRDMVPADIADAVSSALGNAFDAAESESLTVTHDDADGRRWFECCVGPVGSPPAHALVMIRDVTDTQRDRARLERQQEAVWEMMNRTDDLVYVTDAAGRLQDWNRALEVATGYDGADLLGRDLRELVEAEDPRSLAGFEWSVRLTGRARTQVEVKSPAGNSTPYELSATAVADPDGSAAVLGIGRNVAERTEYVRRLEQQRSLMENILVAIDDIFYLFDADGTLRLWNQSLTEVTGYTDAEVDGTDPTKFFAPEDHDRIIKGLGDGLATGSQQIEADLVTKDGQRIPYQFVASAFEMPDGERVLCGIGRNITDRVEREQQLGAFGHFLRHNVRNKMTVIFGQTDFLHAAVSVENRPHLDRIEHAGEALVRVSEKGHAITDVLLNQVVRERVDLEPLVTSEVDAIRERFPDADLVVDVPADAAVLAIEKLALALRELLENACKYNDAPTVAVTADVRETEVRLSVADDGTGLSPNEANVITGSAPITPTFHGSGMGLWLVRWIVRQSGGDVCYRETDAGGARFDLLLERTR